MSTWFEQAEEARDFGIALGGIDPKTVTLMEDNTLKVQFAAGFLSDPDTPEGQERIKKDMEGQTEYRFKNRVGIDVAIVVAPFRNGFCVWGVILPDGPTIRF